ncbi:hypothetical protein RUM43_015028 [Polyplax serrata]|uniref:Uncharacterized protein n=1 Tax=Polyplax serrata TaxID=468196 RepID=A0AAN8PFT3_POLSC
MMSTVLPRFVFLLALLSISKELCGQVFVEKPGYGDNNNEVLLSGSRRQQSFVDGQRVKRQEANATTPKPKKHRPSNIFNLISVLVTETREDANRAFNEIGTLFNSQFVNSTGKTTTTTTTTTTTVSSPTAALNSTTEEEDAETTTEPFRITRNEFLGVLRSNVQGLVNLFGKEFRVAIKVRAAKEEEETIW